MNLVSFLCVFLEISMVTEVINGEHGDPHFCLKTYTVQVATITSYQTSCGWWGIGRCSRYKRVYRTKLQSDPENCCDGFRGEYCDIPMCSSCETNELCIGPDECHCRSDSTGSSCILAACKVGKDCYPGTCNETGLECICASDFAGENCKEMKYAGSFVSCNTELYSSTQTEATFSGQCGEKEPDESHSNNSYFSNMRSITRMVFDYEAIFHDRPDMPNIPSEYMVQARFGIIDSYIISDFIRKNNPLARNETSCIIKVAEEGQSKPGNLNPHASLYCTNISESTSYTIEDNDRLEIEVVIQSGGFKQTKNPPTNLTYSGTTLSQYLHMTFDIKPPFHCKENGNCQDHEVACSWMPDLAMDRNVTVRWFGWNDAVSGIKEYRYTIYIMELDGNKLLVEREQPFRGETVWTSGEEALKGMLVDIPAMYSIILEVVDYAGNSRKARSLTLFDDTNKLEMQEEHPVLVTGLSKWNDAFWVIHDSQQQLIVTWENRFMHPFHVKHGLLNEVKPRDDLIDDDTGNRTTKQVEHVNGVVRFDWTYNKDKTNSLSNTPEGGWTDSGLEQSCQITDALQEGESMVVFVRAHDAVRNSKMESITIHIDTSEALYDANESRFERNVSSLPDNLDYGSRYIVWAKDIDSGIRAIEFELLDITSVEEIIVINGTSVGQLHPQTSDQCLSTGDCYCISLGQCYSTLQSVWINNCELADLDGHRFRLKFTIVNGAGSRTLASHDIGILQDLDGIGYYPAVKQFRSLNSGEFDTKITLAWNYEAACYKIHSVRLNFTDRDTQGEVEISGDMNTYELTNLSPNIVYSVQLTVVYVGGQMSDARTLNFSTGVIAPVAVLAGNSGIGTSVIAGITVAGVAVFLLVVLILVFVFRRKRRTTNAQVDITSHGQSTGSVDSKEVASVGSRGERNVGFKSISDEEEN